ncbi:MAG: glycoside hydrolase family 3 protein [Flavobacteriia bacterium]|nr:glycoside hydrolase family 3 protein [Flavobacteriia bacterium]
MKLFSIFFILILFLNACGQTSTNNEKKIIVKSNRNELSTTQNHYQLSDFLDDNKTLEKEVEHLFSQLDDTSIVAQLLMPAIGRLGQTETVIDKLVKNRMIGGLLMLNGTKEQFTQYTKKYDEWNKENEHPLFLYSADAEPSLINRKIIGSKQVKKANEMKNLQEVLQYTDTICSDLLSIGINYNFAPVVDMSPNKTVGFRSFGNIPSNIIPWSEAFIQTSQKQQIIATAKHFPGHGLVSGDTHKALQVIDGELRELKTYPPLIESGVLSIMIAHIAVKNNPIYDTKGLPSTLSPLIVTDLLRKQMGFNGLIVTDAMNMGGVSSFKNASVMAIDAGCDILLMPLNSEKAFSEILAKYRNDSAFKNKVDIACKRILRMKMCLNRVQ